MLTLLTGWTLGVVLGMRHSLEPDHLAAVSTLVAERRGPAGAARLGALWGLGHTLSLLVSGALLLALRRQMPDRLADFFELVVAIMLLALGARALRVAVTAMHGGDEAEHDHRRHVHLHAGGPIAHLHVGRLALARQPLFIGMLHGLAGSGALTALVLSSMPTALSAMVYVALFGCGSLMGMAILTGIVGLSLQRFAERPRLRAVLVGAAGSASVLLGVTAGLPLTMRLLGLGG